jgi:D-alanyl-D-alanine carboxypeptidase
MEGEQKDNQISKTLYFFNLALLLGVVGMIFLIDQKFEQRKENIVKAEQEVKSLAVFNNLNLRAKAAFVYDVLEDRILYRKNEKEQLPIASITKLMTALVATELLPKNSNITIKSDFLKEEGDSGLLSAESWELMDLLDFSLVTSSNDGMRSVASVIGAVTSNTSDYDLGRKDFIEKMNLKAKDMELEQTFFVNETGLDVDTKVSGGYSSAQNVSDLMKYLILKHPEILEATKYQKLSINSDDRKHNAKNTNDIVNEIPGLFASKTGFTDMAGGNLVIAFDPSIGRPIIITVLGSTLEGRFSDMEALVKASLDYIAE